MIQHNPVVIAFIQLVTGAFFFWAAVTWMLRGRVPLRGGGGAERHRDRLGFWVGTIFVAALGALAFLSGAKQLLHAFFALG